MMKVVAVSDKLGTAIDRLCRGVAPYHTNIDYKVFDVHPKRPDQEQLEKFLVSAKDADIIDYQYFRTADMLRQNYPWLKEKKSILTHNNPYSIRERDWNDYDMVVANNTSMQAELSKITSAPLEYIPLTVDARFWDFNNQWQPLNQAIMVANRIESKKGIREAAIACAELGLKFILVGAISDMDYFNGVMAAGNVEFYEQITDEELKQLYYQSLIHICNSKDDFESGTLPILEAMLCGTPVLTRTVGHVPELNNGHNMFIYNGDYEDVIKLTQRLKEVIAQKDSFEEVRQKAWNTAKNRNFERRAYGYQKLYRSLLNDETTVSIVTAIYDKPEITQKCLEAIALQTHQNIELIVCNDNPEWKENYQLVQDFAARVKFPVRFINKPSAGYGLAKQRNMGIIEATGEIIVICDQRIIMEPSAVTALVSNVKPRTWVYGSKGVKKDFVENFSAIYRQDIVRIGMFNERCTKYGALSQETRSRAKYNGYQIDFIPDAKAEQIGKSSNKHNKKQEIIESKNWLWKVEMEM